MKVLLHACCAPCAIYPFEVLKKQGHEVFGFFYNPNIYPEEEYLKRRQALEQFSDDASLRIFYCPSKADDFKNAIGNWSEKLQRCRKCWQLRLGKAAEFAKKSGFDAFATTLLVSPYQDHDSLRNVGKQVAEEKKIDFLYLDFREGFKSAQEKAKQIGIYRQKYCGCEYSVKEKCLK